MEEQFNDNNNTSPELNSETTENDVMVEASFNNPNDKAEDLQQFNTDNINAEVPADSNGNMDYVNAEGPSNEMPGYEFAANTGNTENPENHEKLKKAKKQKTPRENNSKSFGRIMVKTVSAVVGAAAVGLIITGTVYFTGDKLGIFNKSGSGSNTVKKISSTVVAEETSLTTADSSSDSSSSSGTVVTDVSNVVENVMPSIVSITSKQKVESNMNDWFSYYYGYGNGSSDGSEEEEETGAGSGIIIGQNDTELLIVTNNHVVEGADSLVIQFIDGSDVNATIKGTDSDKDLAVVAVKLSDIESDTLDEIKVATLGDSDSVKVGEATIAIGNALGYGQSVTCGVVSAVDREVTVEDRTMSLIQTDAAINPGNSGGALLNAKGEVIGINAAKYSSSSVEGMGFAIPISSVSDIIEDLMNQETKEKVDSEDQGYLNIYGKDVTDEISELYGAPEGVLVADVIENGAADKAGIEKSDIITKINGQSVNSMDDLQEQLEYYKKGEKVTITIEYVDGKQYKEKEIEVELGDQME